MTRFIWKGLSVAIPTLSLLVVVLLTIGRVETAELAISDTILIDALLYDGIASGEPDEAIRLMNVGDEAIDLEGWSINDAGDTNSRMVFPAGIVLSPAQSIWIADEAAAFRAQFGFDPDLEAADLTGSWVGFSNAGDEAVLFDAADQIVDALIYENGKPTAVNAQSVQWEGEPLDPYKITQSTPVEGQILLRKRHEVTGLLLPDTNTSSDWIQDPADPITGRRVVYPGWDLDLFSAPAAVTATARITLGIAPDNGFVLMESLINQAQISIQGEAHTFENAQIADLLIDAAERGVQVDLLLEGGPPGGVDDVQKVLCQRLAAAGGSCSIMVSDNDADIQNRYRFIHAKFLIVDGAQVLVSSENLSPNSLPADDKADGTAGRRGVLLVTDASEVVDHFETLWAADFDAAQHADVQDISVLDPIAADFVMPEPENPTTYTVRYPAPALFEGTARFEIVQAPENSLSATSGILPVLNAAGAGDVILVQQQYERTYWGTSSSNPIDDPNLRLEAYIEAARRGAEVWVMLDSFFDDPESPTGNTATCQRLKEIAEQEELLLKCQINNPAGLGIHNKMILAQVDGVGYSYIGSINGSESSHKESREAAVLVASDEVYAYLAELFVTDWRDDLFFPILLNGYLAPAGHPLITEVYPNPFGGLDAEEFIEIANPTGSALDLSGFSVSDGQFPTDFADLKRFPAGTVLEPGDTLIVAQQAAAFAATFGITPDFEVLESDPAVPNLIDDPSWGDPNQFLRLGNGGDWLYLRDPADQIVDAVAYGIKQISGQPSCEAPPSGSSLRRNPFDRDTDDCPADFAIWPAPDPGVLP